MLPAGYESLEPFVEKWAVSRASDRARLRCDSDAAELRAFYDAAEGKLGQALGQLNTKKLAELDAAEQRLMQLMLALAHVTLAVEVQRDHEAARTRARRRVTIRKAMSES